MVVDAWRIVLLLTFVTAVPSEAVEHREESTVVDDVEQAQDLTHPPAHDRECGARLDGDASAFDLEEGKGHGRQDDMVRPALKGAALEVIEAELVFQFAILLFDR